MVLVQLDIVDSGITIFFFFLILFRISSKHIKPAKLGQIQVSI